MRLEKHVSRNGKEGWINEKKFSLCELGVFAR
jgi:hypothetical protein